MTKDEATKFLRKLYKIPKVKVTDKNECEQLLTLFRLMEPIDQSSNQHSWTSTYQVGDTQYDVTTDGDDYDCETEILRYCSWEEMGL
jgi:hypothetical protein